MSLAAPAPTAHGVLADALPGARVRDAALVVAGAAIVATLGQVALPLPFTPVPLSLGTFAVLVVGAALGPARALLSIAVLLAAGLAGAPVFADATSGWAFASFGYVLGYAPAAALLGHLARRGGDRSPWRTVLAALAATSLVYVLGVPWLMAFLGIGLVEALLLGVVPFLLGDAIKATAAALLLPGAWQLFGRPGPAPGGAGKRPWR